MAQDVTLPRKYCTQMEEVKKRIDIVSQIDNGKRFTNDELFDYEIVSIHFRKILELIAFSTMIANIEIYKSTYKNFSNHWKAKTMLDSLEKIHPDFYPKPIKLESQNGRKKHFDVIKTGYLTKDDFIFLYDRCSEVLHTWNPFTEKERHVDFKYTVVDWISRIQNLLKLHLIRFIDRDEIWMVTMHNPDTGKVHAFTANPTST